MSAARDQCESNTLVSKQLYSQSGWGVKKKPKLSVLTGLGRAGWVASDVPRHLPSCRHPVQRILGRLNRGTQHSTHGWGLTGWTCKWASISLQDAGAFPVVHVVSCTETEGKVGIYFVHKGEGGQSFRWTFHCHRIFKWGSFLHLNIWCSSRPVRFAEAHK